MMLNLYNIAYPVTALGPGQRVALWVAGCPLRCKGCITPHLLAADAGKNIDVHRLARHLLELPVPLDGLTLTGGEPFVQAAALAALLAQLKAERPHWNVLTFSGFTLKQWQAGDVAQRQLLQQIDILVDGPYVQGRPGRHPLAASANQGVRLLTSSARALEAELNALEANTANLGVSPAGQDCLIGIIDSPARRRYHRGLRLDATDMQHNAAAGSRPHVEVC